MYLPFTTAYEVKPLNLRRHPDSVTITFIVSQKHKTHLEKSILRDMK